MADTNQSSVLPTGLCRRTFLFRNSFIKRVSVITTSFRNLADEPVPLQPLPFAPHQPPTNTAAATRTLSQARRECRQFHNSVSDLQQIYFGNQGARGGVEVSRSRFLTVNNVETEPSTALFSIPSEYRRTDSLCLSVLEHSADSDEQVIEGPWSLQVRNPDVGHDSSSSIDESIDELIAEINTLSPVQSTPELRKMFSNTSFGDLADHFSYIDLAASRDQKMETITSTQSSIPSVLKPHGRPNTLPPPLDPGRVIEQPSHRPQTLYNHETLPPIPHSTPFDPYSDTYEVNVAGQYAAKRWQDTARKDKATASGLSQNHMTTTSAGIEEPEKKPSRNELFLPTPVPSITNLSQKASEQAVAGAPFSSPKSGNDKPLSSQPQKPKSLRRKPLPKTANIPSHLLPENRESRLFSPSPLRTQITSPLPLPLAISPPDTDKPLPPLPTNSTDGEEITLINIQRQFTLERLNGLIPDNTNTTPKLDLPLALPLGKRPYPPTSQPRLSHNSVRYSGESFPFRGSWQERRQRRERRERRVSPRGSGLIGFLVWCRKGSGVLERWRRAKRSVKRGVRRAFGELRK